MNRESIIDRYVGLLPGLAIMLGLYLISLRYDFFGDAISEIVGVALAFSIYVVIWHSRRFLDNDYFLVIGIAYAFVGGLHLLHLLAYEHIGLLGPVHDDNLANQFWLAGRYVQSLSLLIATWLIGRKLKTNFVFLVYAVVTFLILGSIFWWKGFPAVFVEGVGTTTFRKGSEYLISLILSAAALALWRKRKEFDPGVFRFLLWATILSIPSVMLYARFELIAHLVQLVSFYLMYKAIVEVGLNQPYSLLFRNLKQSEQALRNVRDQLERRVEERTAELAKANALLRQDGVEREYAQEELRQHYDTQTTINSVLQLSLEDVPLDDILKRALDLIVAIPWLAFESMGAVFLVEDDPEVLVMKAQRGLSDAVTQTCALVPWGHCLCGRAALTQEIEFADGIDERHETYWQAMEPHGHYCVPIVFAGTTRGVLNIYLRTGHQRDPKEEEFLTAIANTLAGVIMWRRTGDDLKDAERRYRELVEGLVTIVWEADAQSWQFTFVNKRAEVILGYPADRWLSDPDFFVNHLHADDRQETISLLRQVIQERRPHEFACRMIAADGSAVWLQVLVAAEWVGDEPVRLKGLMMDVTPLKEAEAEKEEIQAQLVQAQKMDAIGALAGGIAHDFNNLLTTIRGYADLAAQEVDEAQPLHKDLQEIQRAAARAANLTRQLLLFSRKQSVEPTLLNINALIEGLLKMLNRLIGEDITIKTDLEAGAWTVSADKGTIEQTITNLLVNARDAMPEGGTITIRTENVTLGEDDRGVIAEARPGRFVRLSVSDMGTGMSKETLQHIFDPFFTTKGTGKGTGLGLSVVHGIVKQHGGWIKVDSEPGRGSTFEIYLPASSAKPKRYVPTEQTSLEGLQGGGERILVVEDDPAVREFVRDVLRGNGYTVFEAANATEATAVFEAENGNFHLVFSDMVLPDRNGLQLADQLLSGKPELRVLLCSGYSDEKSRWTAVHERGWRLLQKPYPLAELLRAIREAIADAGMGSQT